MARSRAVVSSARVWPTLQAERALLRRGYSLVAGVDEAGRGPLAGPLLAAPVVLPLGDAASWFKLLRDSKFLSPDQRERAYGALRAHAVAMGVGLVEPEDI